MAAIRYYLLLCVLASGCPGASILLDETFKGTTASGWVFKDSAQLTAASNIDSVGAGWLRLTNNSTNQTGFAYDNTAVPFGYGIDASFRYKTWGGTGADGFAFVLFDGNTIPNTAGAYGGSLGYAQHGTSAGLAGAILGIGFDEFGNYSNPTEGRQGGPGFVPGAVTIRGPGDGTANAISSTGAVNYDYLFSSGAVPAYISPQYSGKNRPSSAASDREAEVIADTSQIPYGHLPITVYLAAGGGPKVLVAQYDAYSEVLAYYGNDPMNIPSNIKFGFTGSTGGSTDYHEIQGLQVNSIQTAPGYAVVVPEASTLTCSLLGVAMICAGRFRRGVRS